MTDERSTAAAGSGPGLATLLTVLFVGLKLGGVINWSWWWVVSPIWISVGLAVVIFLGLFLVIYIADKEGRL